MQEFSDNLSTLSYVSRRRIPLWLYDSKKKAFLGRTALSWFLCILFYLVYYTCLAGFFVGMLWLFLYITIPEDRPARTGKQSVINFRPGLGFRPLVDVQKSLIHFATNDPQQYLIYTQNIDAFLDIYNDVNAKPDGQFATCQENSTKQNDIEKVCKFPLSKLGPCNRSNTYGYPYGAPCVILKLNKVYGWLPDITDPSTSNHALVKCAGQNNGDKDNAGEIGYYPSVQIDGESYGVFDSVYFPFIGQPGYLGPLVAVQFKSPKKYVIILIKCELLNLQNSYVGELNFELLID